MEKNQVTDPKSKMWVLEFDGLPVISSHSRWKPWDYSEGDHGDWDFIIWNVEDIMEEFGFSTLDFNDPRYCPDPKMTTRLAERCFKDKGMVSQEIPFVSFLHPWLNGAFDKFFSLVGTPSSKWPSDLESGYFDLIRNREDAIEAMKGRRI